MNSIINYDYAGHYGLRITNSERDRLFDFNLHMAMVKWNLKKKNEHFQRLAVWHVKDLFKHTLYQWKRIGEAKGKGNRANRRIKEINKVNGPYVNWPSMTITSD